MCNKGCAKAFLFIINFLIFLLGAAALGIGIWLTVNRSSLFNLLKNVDSATNTDLSSTLSSTSLLQIASIVLLAGGGVLTLLGFCGCAGAWWESKLLLILYVIASVLVFLTFIAAGVLAIIILFGSIGYVEPFITRSLNETFDDNLNSNNTLSLAWYEMMQLLQCCGWKGPSDFSLDSANSTTYYWDIVMDREVCVYNSTSSSSPICWNGTESLVPSACCQYSSLDNIIALNQQAAGIVNWTCPNTLASSYTTGCRGSLQSFIDRNAIFILCFAFGTALLQIFAIVAAASIIRSLTVKFA